MEQTLQIETTNQPTKGAGVYKNIVSYYNNTMERAGFLPFQYCKPFILFGEFPNYKTWLFYISVVKSEIDSIIMSLGGLLDKYSFSIAVPENSLIAGNLLDGSIDIKQCGKVISIEYTGRNGIDDFATDLIHITTPLAGPEILNANYLGGRLYVDFDLPAFAIPGTDFSDSIKAEWPFKKFLQQPKKGNFKRLGKYLLMSQLKDDPKGYVYRALSIKSWLNIHWCVIKQARAYQSTDEFGRDIRNRLEWQIDVHQRMQHLKILPAIHDVIVLNDDLYVAMEFIEGTGYHQYVCELQEGVRFNRLGDSKQIELILAALSLVKIISQFHDNGLLHRDVSPMNFIVQQDHSVRAIDVELSFDYNKTSPDPWFTLGTEGYMSPAQRELYWPSVEDDIYGLGGILIFTFTGVSLSKFEKVATDDELFERVNYFIGDRRLSSVLANTRNTDPSLRPSLSSVEHNLNLYHAKLLTGNPKKEPAIEPSMDVLDQLIGQSLPSFANLPVTIGNNNKLVSDTINYNFQDGLAGILYTITDCDISGFDYSLAGTTFPAFSDTLLLEINSEEPFSYLKAGLFTGTSGIAIIIAKLIKHGFVEQSIILFSRLSGILNRANDSVGFYEGIAGQGLAMMKSAELLNFPNLSSSIPELADLLIRQQNKDGSWNSDLGSDNKRKVQATGLFHGTAGIVYFLIVAHHKYYDSKYKQSAERGLNWLAKQKNKNKETQLPPVNTINNSVDPWLEFGFTGVAYTYLKAFEFYQLPEYKYHAEHLLSTHPEFITSNYNCFVGGLAGLGEVYLEAFRILKDNRWLNRALLIFEFLKNTNCVTEDNKVFWLEGNDHLPSPGFGSGNAGVLHFLLRLRDPNKIEFPLIDFRP